MHAGKDEQINLRTGWDLYRALSLYDYPKEMVARARTALGTDHLRPFYSGHARYIVQWHKLDSPRMKASIGPDGVDLIVRAFTFEIQHGTRPESIADVMRVPLFSERLAPISFTLDEVDGQLFPSIVIHPLAYKDAHAFALHVAPQLTRLYARLEEDATNRSVKLNEVEESAHEEFLRTAERVQEKVERIAKERGRDAFNPLGTLETAFEYFRQKKKWQYNPKSGLTGPEWDFFHRNLVLDDEGSCQYTTSHELMYAARREMTTRHDSRANKYDSLPRHAAWWAACVVEGNSQEQLARDDKVSPAAVSKAISALEQRHDALMSVNRQAHPKRPLRSK